MSNVEIGNDKESHHDEVGDLLERYSTFLHYHDHISLGKKKKSLEFFVGVDSNSGF